MELYIITYIPVLLTGIWAFYKYNKKRKLENFDLFVKYREKLKTNPANLKIVRHVQDWQLNPELRSQINEREITINDFYDFLGFYEEISLLYQKKLIPKRFVKDMFSFYAIQIADNEYYWNLFDENYLTDDDWINYRKLVLRMR